MNSVQMADRASAYVEKLYASEYRGWGDKYRCIERLAEEIGVPFWSLAHIKRGRAKSVETSLYQRIRRGYLRYCRKKAAALLADIRADERAHEDADFGTLADEAEAFVRKIDAALEEFG